MSRARGGGDEEVALSGLHDERTVSALRDAGLSLDRQVQEYLMSGRKMKGSKHVNLNDDIAAFERGGGSAERVRKPRSQLLAEVDVESMGRGGMSSKTDYAQFEELLAQREERKPSASDPKPARDTKRSLGVRTLRNMQIDGL